MHVGAVHPQETQPQIAKRARVNIDGPVDFPHAGFAGQTSPEYSLRHQQRVEVDVPPCQCIGARKARHEHHQTGMLAPIRMHPDRAGKSHAAAYATGRDRTDAAPLVATTETFDIAVEKPKGAGLVVERAIRPVVHSYSQCGDCPADRVSSAQAECVAHGVWPEARLIDWKQRHPAVAVRSIDFKECVEGHERKAQAQLSDRIFDTQEQRNQQLLGSVVDRNLAKNGR